MPFFLLISVFSYCVIIGFCLSIYLVAQQPPFRESYIWLLQNSRVLYDGMQKVNAFPQCTNHLAWDVPWVLLPGRILASLTHPDYPLGVQLMGAGMFILSLLLLWVYMRRTCAFPWYATLAGTIGLMSLGVFPFIGSMFRPETQIVSGIIFMSSFVILAFGRALPLAYRLGLVPAFFLVLEWFYGLHPEALLFTPALLLLAWNLPVKKLFLRVSCALLTLYMAWESYRLWEWLPVCPESRIVSRMFSAHALLPQLLWAHPMSFLYDALYNLMHTYKNYFVIDMFGTFGISRFVRHVPELGTIADGETTLLLILLGLLLVSMLVHSAIKMNYMRVRPASYECFAYSLAILLLGALAVQLMVKKSGLWYDTIFVFPVFLFVMGLLASAFYPPDSHTRFKAVLFCVILLTTLLNQWCFVEWMGPEKRHDSVDKDIIRAAAACHIPLDQTGRHIYIDQTTYLPFKYTYQPLMSEGLKKGKASLTDMMKQEGSSGAVMRCHNMSPYTSHFIHYGPICCTSDYITEKSK